LLLQMLVHERQCFGMDHGINFPRLHNDILEASEHVFPVQRGECLVRIEATGMYRHTPL
jgi:hypothetical protein